MLGLLECCARFADGWNATRDEPAGACVVANRIDDFRQNIALRVRLV
jgi:hypothetical protein